MKLIKKIWNFFKESMIRAYTMLFLVLLDIPMMVVVMLTVSVWFLFKKNFDVLVTAIKNDPISGDAQRAAAELAEQAKPEKQQLKESIALNIRCREVFRNDKAYPGICEDIDHFMQSWAQRASV